MMCSSKLGCGKEEDDTEDAGSWFPCCSLFLLTTLFLLHVASISRSNATRLFSRIQERKTLPWGYQGKKWKQTLKIKIREWINKF